MMLRSDRVGETNVMNSGLTAKIVEYKSSKKGIRLAFYYKDNLVGTRSNISYKEFQKGTVKCPLKFINSEDTTTIINYNTSPTKPIMVDREDVKKIKAYDRWIHVHKDTGIPRFADHTPLTHVILGITEFNQDTAHRNRNYLDCRKKNIYPLTKSQKYYRKFYKGVQ